jgi:hypothetical protein
MSRKALIVVVVLVCLSAATGASTGADLANVSGPDILKSIGPTEPRTDNPVAAGVTAVAVAAVILRGLWKDRKEQESEE